jgi:3'(2'), 5'-bisphosphate nucleotidase
VSDVHGAPLDFSRGRRLEDNRGVVATNRRIHGEVLAAISAVLDGSARQSTIKGG